MTKASDFSFPYQLLHKTCVFQGERFAVWDGRWKGPEGKEVSREWVSHPGAVVILPFVDENHLLLIQNARLAVEEILWELPAGTLELNETPDRAAKREMIEETGFEALELKHLFQFYPTPGFCDEVLHAFVAKNLIFRGQSLDESEDIQVKQVHWNDALEMIKKGKICDAKTIATLLYFRLMNP